MGRRVLEIERDGLQGLLSRIDTDFVRACERMMACTGRIVVTGMGKSGHIGGKIAATLASTGTPAFFVHPGEASHGDLGMITRQDVVLAISYSGETAEIVTILPLIKRMGAPLIAMTGKPNSTMAKMSDVHLNVAVDQEACPMNLAPTASTTATVISSAGDAALSIADPSSTATGHLTNGTFSLNQIAESSPRDFRRTCATRAATETSNSSPVRSVSSSSP